MSRSALGILAIVAALALAAWIGFGDGREHRQPDRAEGSAG